MNFILQPWQLMLVVLAGWVNRQQQQTIEYLRTENSVIKEKLGKKRILLNDDQRRRLAVKAKVLGRHALSELVTIVTPITLLRWHRQLVAQKWNYTSKRGRPRVREEIVNLVLRMARENPTWGYDRIQGAMENVGHKISDSTVANILKAHGIEPAPDRKRQTTWRTFLKAHWESLASIDFTTVEVWTKGGLVTYYLLFVMELATRRVHFAGCTPAPDGKWMAQIARNLTDTIDGFLLGKRFLILDRDTKYSFEFRRIIEDAGVELVRLPPRSPNLSPHIERFMRSIKDEALERMIFFGEGSLRNTVIEFMTHYHAERNHQGLDNRLIEPSVKIETGSIKCRERLGGLLRYYHRPAA